MPSFPTRPVTSGFRHLPSYLRVRVLPALQRVVDELDERWIGVVVWQINVGTKHERVYSRVKKGGVMAQVAVTPNGISTYGGGDTRGTTPRGSVLVTPNEAQRKYILKNPAL